MIPDQYSTSIYIHNYRLSGVQALDSLTQFSTIHVCLNESMWITNLGVISRLFTVCFVTPRDGNLL